MGLDDFRNCVDHRNVEFEGVMLLAQLHVLVSSDDLTGSLDGKPFARHSDRLPYVARPCRRTYYVSKACEENSPSWLNYPF